MSGRIFLEDKLKGTMKRECEAPEPDQILEQVRRIAGSSGFSGSESLRNVLLYLTRQAIEHPGKTVKEYEIATQALGRAQNFDSRIDSAVRANASRLRSKLAEYYLHEGANDTILIDLSKGSYSLIFSFREKAPPPAQPPVTVSEPEKVAVVPMRWHPLLLAGCIIGLAVAVGLAYLAGRNSAHATIAASTQKFWGDFLKGGDPLVVFSNPTFRGLPETGLQLVDPDIPGGNDTIDLFTGTGEAMALEALTRQTLQLGHDLRAKRVHLFTWDDATNANLIFLGGQVQNGAFAQLPKLQRFSLKSPADDPFRGQGAVHDEKPDPGGESYYLASKDFNRGNDYAIVALMEGVSPGHRILILAGTNTHGTEGATNFLCNSELLKDLLSRLGVTENSPVPPFEALVRVPVRGSAPISPQLVIIYKRQSDSASAQLPHS